MSIIHINKGTSHVILLFITTISPHKDKYVYHLKYKSHKYP